MYEAYRKSSTWDSSLTATASGDEDEGGRNVGADMADITLNSTALFELDRSLYDKKWDSLVVAAGSICVNIPEYTQSINLCTIRLSNLSMTTALAMARLGPGIGLEETKVLRRLDQLLIFWFTFISNCKNSSFVMLARGRNVSSEAEVVEATCGGFIKEQILSITLSLIELSWVLQRPSIK